MLDGKNEELLKQLARNPDTPAVSRVSAVSLAYKLGSLVAKECITILQAVLDDSRTKSGVQVKALELIDKINDATGQEPELDSDGVETAKQNLLEKFLKCPT